MMDFKPVKRRFISSHPEWNGEEITADVYMTDFMKELVGEFGTFTYYDVCLHGHDFRGKECTCPIKKPYLKKGKFRVHHLVSAAEDTPIRIPRWKALEIINDWNRKHAEESAEGQRPIRWVNFLLDGLEILKPPNDGFRGMYKDEKDIYEKKESA